MATYLCQDLTGAWYVASELLTAALDREGLRGPVNVATAYRVQVGTQPSGLRFATAGDYRVVAYAAGGYCRQWRAPAGGGWFLFRAEAEGLPEDVERALCFALGIAYVP
jgi:hypothetical protein